MAWLGLKGLIPFCCIAGNQTGVTIQCLKQGKIMATLDLNFFKDLDTSRMTLRETSCTYSSLSATRVIFVVPVASCGTTAVQSGEYITYNNEISSAIKSGLVVAREQDFQLPFECKFKRSDLHVHDGVSFESTQRVLNTSATSSAGRL